MVGNELGQSAYITLYFQDKMMDTRELCGTYKAPKFALCDICDSKEHRSAECPSMWPNWDSYICVHGFKCICSGKRFWADFKRTERLVCVCVRCMALGNCFPNSIYMPWWVELRRHGSVRVCVKINHFSVVNLLHNMKINHWKVQCKHTAEYDHRYLWYDKPFNWLDFQFKGIVLELRQRDHLEDCCQ